MVLVRSTTFGSARSKPDRQGCEEHDDQAEPEADTAQEDGKSDLAAADGASALEKDRGDQRRAQAIRGWADATPRPATRHGRH
jgi:hypothetical protein